MIVLPFIETFLALVVASAPLTHPHNPKAIVLGGAQGKATLTYFTVPYNKDQVATLPNGSDWHLGSAGFNAAMPLVSGDAKVPVGDYKFNVRRGADGGFHEIVLVPMELYQATSSRRNRATPEQVAELKKKLAEKGIPAEVVLKVDDVKGHEDVEHLGFTAANHGYETVRRMSAEPKSGAKFDLYMSFGDLHKKLTLQETLTAPPKEDGGRGR